jgi:hypothetical protein
MTVHVAAATADACAPIVVEDDDDDDDDDARRASFAIARSTRALLGRRAARSAECLLKTAGAGWRLAQSTTAKDAARARRRGRCDPCALA